MTLQRIFRAEPFVALHATKEILETLCDAAPFVNSAAVTDQPRLSEWLQVGNVDSCMRRDCISGDDDEGVVIPAVELAVEIFIRGGLAATLAFLDAFPEDGHSSGQIQDVSLPCIPHLFVVV